MADTTSSDFSALPHLSEEIAAKDQIDLEESSEEITQLLDNEELDDMEAKGPIRITEAEEAQKQILRKARKLSDAGELMLSGRGDDFV